MNAYKKMREALIQIRELTTPCEGVTSIELQVNAIACSALAEPQRNGDEGMAEKQYARFVAMCHSNVDLSGRCRESCPFRRVSAGYCDRAECYAKWAQMPYNESEVAE